MDNRQLLLEDFIEMVDAMQNATHEVMGTLTALTRRWGISSQEKDAVLIHGFSG
jgi:hypothetical protein